MSLFNLQEDARGKSQGDGQLVEIRERQGEDGRSADVEC